MESLASDGDDEAVSFALVVDLDFGQILQAAWFGRVTLGV